MKYFIGTYTSQGGPGACVIDHEGDKLTLLSACAAIRNPTYFALTRDGRTLYTTASLDEAGKIGAVGAYRVEGNTLAPLSVMATGGANNCHIALSPSEKFIYAANYSSGSVSALPVKDGYIMPAIQHIKHDGASGAVKGRQDAPHTHQCAFRPESEELFVCDLGMDIIRVYDADAITGRLTHACDIKAPEGSGPRHIVFDGRDRLYLLCELSNEVIRYEFASGEWQLTDRRITLPAACEKESAAAAIRLTPEYLYASNRGYDSVARYKRLHGGALGDIEIIQIKGASPRDIWITPNHTILAANQYTGGVEVVQEGATVKTLDIAGAVCIHSYAP